ncbi:hypothetical protein BKD09_16250 [Bradyrhizobium japonicum]|uniref:Uncharacterized protein n=1 Tax=Bradyrhizobium japonicum TaxID=375 RepID=A0A1L3F9E2_BRAJP|nr:hypothetical protein [Bradyrhizobium japonicum]APG09884.1 hypothetical protein BKD09_16250 [Bradyrhizobium japonicum]MBR0729637.1 hypothetical protein [Bradyrhizobium japonicum]
MMDDEGFEPIADTLACPPIQIDDRTTPDSIEAELRERLEALLASHNGLEPTLEGWRDLALALALRHEPAFQIETPADRMGRSGIGGRPAGWTGFTVRSAVKAELRRGAKSQRVAAKVVAERFGLSLSRVQNIMSERPSPPDVLRRRKYELVVEKACAMAAKKVSRE